MDDQLEIPGFLRRSTWTAEQLAMPWRTTSQKAAPKTDYRRPKGVDDETWNAYLAVERKKQQAENARLNALPKKERA